MKIIPLILLILFIFPLVSAGNLGVEVLEKKSVVIFELDDPAEFTLLIKNNNNLTDKFEIYSLVGISITPRTLFTISENSEKELKILATPHKETKRDFKGYYTFEYQIKGQQTGFYTDRLTIKIVELKNAVEIKSVNINPDEEEAILIIKNLEDTELSNITITASSLFFDFSENLDFLPGEQKEFVVPVKKEQIKKLSAGEYEANIKLAVNGKESEKTSVLTYLEKGDIAVSEEIAGLVIRKKTITKTNQGNIITVAKITDSKDILSRLFTTYSEKPLTSERKGLFVRYYWEKELAPAEQLSVTQTTNYTFPLVLLAIVILVILIVRFFVRKELSLQKRVSFLRTKGGEFALKVKVRVKATKPVKNIKIADRLPGLTKLYEKFGTKPDKIDEKSRQMFWSISSLNAGEERVFTYIIYSKIRIIGNFELPAARASYQIEVDGKPKAKDVYSNRTSFAAETTDKLD